MHLVGLIGIDFQSGYIQIDPARLRVVRIEVDDRENHVRARRIHLQIGDQLIVLYFAEMQPGIRLQCSILPPNAVHAGDQRPEAVGLLQGPMPQLIFFRVAIFLAPRFSRRAFHQLVRRPIYAVVRGERRGKNQSCRIDGSQARLEGLGKDIGRIGPNVGPVVLPPWTLIQFREVIGQLLLGIAPRKIRIRLGEPELSQTVHDLRPRKGLGQVNDIRMIAFGRTDQPFPEGERLGVRIIDAKYFDTAGNPEIDHAFEFVPQGAPIACFEIERIDVLVFLWRILSVLHAAVGPMLEPLRMLRHVRMVGSALKGNVHGDFDAQRARHVQEPIEVIEGAELRQNILMAAFRGTDSPGTADIVGFGAQRIVRALAVDAADGMNGRKIQHIDPHFRKIRQPRLDIAEFSVLPDLHRGRSRK